MRIPTWVNTSGTVSTPWTSRRTAAARVDTRPDKTSTSTRAAAAPRSNAIHHPAFGVRENPNSVTANSSAKKA